MDGTPLNSPETAKAAADYYGAIVHPTIVPQGSPRRFPFLSRPVSLRKVKVGNVLPGEAVGGKPAPDPGYHLTFTYVAAHQRGNA